jgi:hypothetical protein
MSCHHLLAPAALCLLAWSAPALAEDPPAPRPQGPAPVLEVAAPPPDAPPPAANHAQTTPLQGEPSQSTAKKEPEPLSAESSIVGLQLSSTRAPGYTDPAFGASAAVQVIRISSLGEQSHYERSRFTIGGGSAGFEGALDVMTASGFLARIGAHQGIVARIGAQAWVWGNQQLYSSLLSLPEGQLGFQFARGSGALELGLHGGAVLVGRYRPGTEESRKLGKSADYGAYAAIHFAPVHIDLDLVRIDALRAPPNTPVDNLRGSVCLVPAVFSLCFRGDWLQGSTPAASSPRSHDALYLGLLVGGSLL